MTSAPEIPERKTALLNLARGAAGAVLGGAGGYFLFFWLARNGLYALALPGALLGLGCGLLIRQRSVPLAIVCGVAALVLGAVIRWRIAAGNPSFADFLRHFFELRGITLLMIFLGALFGYWFALGLGTRKGR